MLSQSAQPNGFGSSFFACLFLFFLLIHFSLFVRNVNFSTISCCYIVYLNDLNKRQVDELAVVYNETNKNEKYDDEEYVKYVRVPKFGICIRPNEMERLICICDLTRNSRLTIGRKKILFAVVSLSRIPISFVRSSSSLFQFVRIHANQWHRRSH